MTKLLACSFVLLLACGGKTAPAPATAPASGETSSATSCSRDEDCYCRVFDGASFQPGRAPFKCCTDSAGCNDALGATVAMGHCMTCVYD